MKWESAPKQTTFEGWLSPDGLAPLVIFVLLIGAAVLFGWRRARRKDGSDALAGRTQGKVFARMLPMPGTHDRTAAVTELKPCRWHKTSDATASAMQRWECDTCGVDAFSHDGAMPKECKRLLKTSL